MQFNIVTSPSFRFEYTENQLIKGVFERTESSGLSPGRSINETVENILKL